MCSLGSNVFNTVTQKCYFRYASNNPQGTYAIGTPVTFPYDYTNTTVNIPSGYGIQSSGKFLVPYTGLWLFHWDLYYNSACGFAVKSDSTTDTSIYGDANNYDNKFYSGATQNGSIHASIAGSGGENTTSLVVPIYLRKDTNIWLEKTINPANIIYIGHCAFTGILLSEPIHYSV